MTTYFLQTAGVEGSDDLDIPAPATKTFSQWQAGGPGGPPAPGPPGPGDSVIGPTNVSVPGLMGSLSVRTWTIQGSGTGGLNAGDNFINGMLTIGTIVIGGSNNLGVVPSWSFNPFNPGDPDAQSTTAVLNVTETPIGAAQGVNTIENAETIGAKYTANMFPDAVVATAGAVINVATIATSGADHINALVAGGTLNVSDEFNDYANITVSQAGTMTVNGEMDPAADSKTGPWTNTITITDAGSRFIDNAEFTVGGGSAPTGIQGTLNIQNGATAESNRDVTVGAKQLDNGTVTVNGKGSMLRVNGDLTAGEAGLGNLTVTGGGNLTVDGDLKEGDKAGSVLGSGASQFTGRDTSVSIQGGWDIGTKAARIDTVNGAAAVTVDGELQLGGEEGGDGTLNISGPDTSLTITAANAEVTIGGSGTGKMTLSQGTTFDAGASDVTVGDEAGGGQSRLDIDNATMTAGNLTIGGGGNGDLTMEDDAVLNVLADLSLGDESGSKYSATVQFSTLSVAGSLTVGGAGKPTGATAANQGAQFGPGGNLLLNGADVTAGSVTLGDEAEGKGAVTLSLSRLSSAGDMTIGGAGSGGMLVQISSNVTVGGNISLGEEFGGTGSMTIDNSFVQGDDLTIGSHGKGTLKLQDGAVLLTNGIASIADQTVANVQNVTVTSSLWNVTGDLQVGEAGIGQMTVQTGGQVTVGNNVVIADLIASGGSLSIKGNNTNSTTPGASTGATTSPQNDALLSWGNTLTVGGMGIGTLAVSGGGLVTDVAGAPGVVEIAASPGSVGVLKLSGGSALIANEISVGGTDKAAGGTATLTAGKGDSIQIANQMNLWSGGTVSVSGGGALAIAGGAPAKGAVSIGATGTVAGAGTIAGALTDAGLIDVRDGALVLKNGTLTGAGDVNIETNGTLDLSAAKSGDTIADLNDAGALNLGGTTLTVTDAYTNANWGSGDSFDPTAGVSGGAIDGKGAALKLLGSDVTKSKDNDVLHFSTIAGGKQEATFTLENSGKGATITAALRTAGLAADVSGIAAGDITLAKGQSSNEYTLIYDPSQGSLKGQSLTIESDFANVAPITLVMAAASPLVVSKVGSDRSGVVLSGDTARITVSLSAGATVDTSGGTPDLELSDGAVAQYDSAASNPAAGALVFDYKIGATDSATGLTIAAVDLGGATIQDGGGDDADLSGAVNASLGLNVGAPLVTAVTEAGPVAAGDTAHVTLAMTEGVTVDTAGGVPMLTLNSGGAASYDAAASSPATGSLVFDYVVGAGDHSPDLTITNVALDGGTIDDGFGVAADFTDVTALPTGVRIGASPLTVAAVAMSPAGAVESGTLLITLTMSEPLVVDTSNGLPSLNLNDGGAAYYDTDLSNPAAGTLVFDHLVTPGDYSAALAVSSVSLNGATSRDTNGYNADFSAALVPLAGTSVGVTGVAYVTHTSTASHPVTGDTVAVTLSLTHGISVSGAPGLTLNDGGVAEYEPTASNPVLGRLQFDYVPAAGDYTTDLMVAGVDLNGGAILDSAGHATDLSGAASDLGLDVNAVFVGAAAAGPTTGEVCVGQTVTVTLDMSAGVSVTGAPALLLNDGGSASYDAAASSPSSGDLVFDQVVASGELASDLSITAVALNGGAIQDLNGRAADLSVGSLSALGPQIGAPLSVSTVTASPGGELDAGMTAHVTLTLNNAVSVNGTLSLALNDGGVAAYDTALSNPAAGSLVFDYTAGSADSTPNLEIVAIDLPSDASVQDASGFNADFAQALHVPLGVAIGPAGVTRVSASTSGVVTAGQTAHLTLTMSAPVTVSGAPSLALSNGATAGYDAALSTATSLVFDYTAGAADQQAENVRVLGVTLPTGASISETANGMAANLTGAENQPTGLQTSTPLFVDQVFAEEGSVVIVTGNTVDITLALQEDGTLDTTLGSPTLTLNDGGTAVYNGSTGDVSTLDFLYTAGSNDTTPDLTVTGVNLNGASLVDSSGFNADLSAAINAPLDLPVNPTPVITSVIANAGNVATAGSVVSFFLETNIPVQLTGMPELILNDGGTATFASISTFNQSEIVFDYTVVAGQQVPDLEIGSVDLNGATVRTAGGVPLDFTTAENVPTGQQIGAPLTIATITADPTGGEIDTGGTVRISLKLSEPVALDTSNGTPSLDLSLTSGHQFDAVLTPRETAVAAYDPAASNLGTGLLVFDYTVAAGDETNNLTLSDLNLNGAVLNDAGGFLLPNLFNGTVGLGDFGTGLQIGPAFVNSGFNLVNDGLEAEVNPGQTVQVVLQMSQAVTVTGAPTLTLNNGGTATFDAAGFLGQTQDLVFDYVTGPNDDTPDLKLAGVNLPTGASIRDASGVEADFSGAAGTQFFVQIGADTVTGVTTNFANTGSVVSGETVEITLTVQDFNLTLSGGPPTLTLSNGAIATYDSAQTRLNNDGFNELVFDYNIAPGDSLTSDLRVAAVNLNGATFTDEAGNVADLSGAMNADLALSVAAAPPPPTEVPTADVFAFPPGFTSPNPLVSGETIELGFSFVTVSGGTPTITLNDGGVATYDVEASNTVEAVFDYTVGPTDHVATLDIASFHTNGATITDPFSGTTVVDFSQASLATLDLEVGPSPLTVRSFTSNASIATSGQTIELAATFSEPVTVNNAPTLTLNDGGIATYNTAASDPAAGLLVFDHVVGATDSTLDLEVTAANQNSFPDVQDSNGFQADYSGLLNVATDTEVTPLVVNAVAAAPAGSIAAGETLHVTLVMNEGVTVAGGIPTLTLNNGGTASYDAAASHPSSGHLVFDYVVGTSQQTANLTVGAVNLPSGGTVRDAKGFDADFAAAVNAPTGLRIGPSPLTVTNVAATAGVAEPQAGAQFTVTVTMSEPVTVNTTSGTPFLALNDGGTALYDAATSDPATGTLRFDGTVSSGQSTPNLAIATVRPDGGTVTDAGGASADFSAALNAPTGLPIGPAVVTSVQSFEDEVDTGGTAHVALYLSQGVTVTGTPLLALNDGETASYDGIASTPLSGLLVFETPVGAGDSTADLTVTEVQQDGASVQDPRGVAADLSGAIGQDTGLAVNQSVVACFAAGTRITTEHGPVAVEALRVGDRLVTHDGAVEPIIWIGRRAVDCARHPRPRTVWPVRVSRGAFGNNVPARDLYLSPDHAVFVNDVLVPVKLLVDGSGIVRQEPDIVIYFHVELPRHAVIFAEALTVESYLDDGDRANFYHDDGTIRLYPDFASRPTSACERWETHGAAPLVTTGPLLAMALASVKRRTALPAGWHQPTRRHA